jgi:Fic family protein
LAAGRSRGIQGSTHEPVGAHLVPEAVEELCEYVNSKMSDRTAIHLAAYAMWRLNWIHPFSDGNGRTSRVFSYVVLCVKLGFVLRGTKTIPDQIVANRKPYFEALEAADAACKRNVIDVSLMEALLERLLAIQLTDVFDQATGRRPAEK